MAQHCLSDTHRKDHLTDRLELCDFVLTELHKLRFSLAVMIETYDHAAVLDETDVTELKEAVRLVIETVDFDIIKDFTNG